MQGFPSSQVKNKQGSQSGYPGLEISKEILQAIPTHPVLHEHRLGPTQFPFIHPKVQEGSQEAPENPSKQLH